MKSTLLTAGACFALFLNSFSTIIYVNPTATGNSNGSSWTDAFTNLSQAINQAANDTSSIDSLFIAEGTYFPDVDTLANFRMFRCPAQISLFGGFPATGNPTFADRDWIAFQTILDGDILGDDDGTIATRGDNAKRLLMLDTYGRLDGLIVRNGGDNTGGPGAGLALIGTNNREALIENCVFENNWVTDNGELIYEGGAIRGAAINGTDVLEIRNVVFKNNKAKFGGAVLYGGTLKANNCVFIENEATMGSAIVAAGTGNGSGPATIVQNVFYKNNSVTGVNQGDRSGVIGRLNPSSGNISVINSTFKENTADDESIIYGGNPTLLPTYTEFNNCLIDHSDTVVAFGIYTNDVVQLNNCVTSSTEGLAINGSLDINDGTINTSNWQEGASITYMIEDTSNAVFVLDCNAIGRNEGLNSILPSSILNGLDLAGNQRIQGGTVDVGAYETSTFDRPEIVQVDTTLEVSNGPFDNYQWLLNNTIINGATSPSYIPTADGDYSIVASNNNACGNNSSLSIPVVLPTDTIPSDTSTGINETNLTSVRVWPNPVNDVVQLESSHPIQNIWICDMNGKRMKIEQNVNQQVYVANLPRGIYFIEVKNELNTSFHRIVKL